MFKPQIGPRVLSIRALLLALAAVAGCGEVTSTQQGLVAPAADAGAQVDQLQPAADVGAADAGAEHPALHCGPSTEFRLTVCKPNCGICEHTTSTSTIEGCWTNDTDFHCVHGCGDCR